MPQLVFHFLPEEGFGGHLEKNRAQPHIFARYTRQTRMERRLRTRAVEGTFELGLPVKEIALQKGSSVGIERRTDSPGFPQAGFHQGNDSLIGLCCPSPAESVTGIAPFPSFQQIPRLVGVERPDKGKTGNSLIQPC